MISDEAGSQRAEKYLCRSEELQKRFWSKIEYESNSGCWLWSRGASKLGGYGMFTVRIPTKHTIYAHRASWRLHHGELPTGRLVLHKCDTPRCVNPKHLFLGTPEDNMRDMATKGRVKGGYRAALSGASVRLVVQQLQSKRPIRQIARMAACDPSTVRRIRQRFCQPNSHLERSVKRDDFAHPQKGGEG